MRYRKARSGRRAGKAACQVRWTVCGRLLSGRISSSGLPAGVTGGRAVATDGTRDWTTIGVSPNIIEASWRALEDSLVYGLLHRSLNAV